MLTSKKTFICFKLFLVLIFWALVLICIQKLYNDKNPYIDFNNQIQRAKKFTNFLKKHHILSDPEGNIAEIGELLTDKSNVTNNEQLLSAIESELPSIPIRYWYSKPSKRSRNSPKCTKFPSIFNLHYHNKFWQTFTIQNHTIQLYNAYFDTRKELKAGPVVRVLTMSNVVSIKFPVFCQLWYDGSTEPSISKATNFVIWFSGYFPHGLRFTGKSFACPIGNQSDTAFRIPKVVSLVANECEQATNALRIHYDVPIEPKQKFAVCIKGMSFLHDFSARLVEWIELQLILGASKIFFYQLSLHPNVTKVLNFYAKRGLVDFRPTTLADGVPDLRFLQYYMVDKQRTKKTYNEQIVYNDCFYRNLYRYEYISVQDIDEVLMPTGNYTSWSELVAIGSNQHTRRCPNGHASYCFRHWHFSNWIPNYDANIPHFMHILQHVQRQTQRTHPPQYNTKCFHRTDRVVMMHNHLPWKWLNVCQAYYFNETVARLHHYRKSSFGNNTILDLSVRKFQDDLLNRSLDALEKMGFLKTQK